ncbi:MAG: hypothetical protein ACD_8C00051G0006 [uncultured bacterium]|nr:MAG: hypothetical protein ACD_8C00051G0006 [uncultured bacterium]
MENIDSFGGESEKGISQSINSGNTIAILIDMQETFVDGLRPGEKERIIPNQIAVLKYCNKLSIPVIVLELNIDLFGKTIGVLISQAKKNPNFRLIEKWYSDGFMATGLDRIIRQFGNIENLLILGVNADYCVKFTARSGIKKGYRIVTSNELISGQRLHSPDNSIDWFRNNGMCFDSMADFSGILQRS